MHYEKMTFDKFRENLESNRYHGSTGARRAIGKVEWPKAVKDSAYSLIDKHYKDEVKEVKTLPEKRLDKLKAKAKRKNTVSDMVEDPQQSIELAATTVDTLTKALTFLKESGSCEQGTLAAGLESLAIMVRFIDNHVVAAISKYTN